MRTPLIAANWKMNTTVNEGIALARAIKLGLEGISGVESVICPPFVSLIPVAEVTRGSSLKLGAQNVYHEEKGAYTGEISPLMLKGFCEFVIVGHSERRQYCNETPEIVNKKMRAAIKSGLKPILCVGENLKENEAGKTEAVVSAQVRAALDGINAPGELAIAYEPIWAIGSGKAATGGQAAVTISLIRSALSGMFGRGFAGGVRILYGGSVNPDNITEFMSESEIDGALVGGASLRADQFTAIIRKAAEAKSGK